MKTIFKIIVVLGLVLRCVVVPAQDTCVHNFHIDDSLLLRISNCTIGETPRELQKYKNEYAKATVCGMTLYFNDSIYHDSTELTLEKVDVFGVFFEPKVPSVDKLIVMRYTEDGIPDGWTNRKRDLFLKRLSKELCRQFQKGKFTLIFKENRSTPFYIRCSNDMTIIERL